MYRRTGCLVLFVLLLSLPGGASRADLIIAERLLVDLRAEDLAYGEATSWPNRGTLGDFKAFGTSLVETVGGMKCVTFDGSSWFEGPDSTPGFEGAGTRSIEVWAYNPSIPGEETLLSWAHRGGPEGSNMSFNYGSDSRWGAVGHWGGGTHDMGWWGSHSPAPAANTWWHLAYTYDGKAARLYVNGVEESFRNPIVLNTHGGTPIRVAAQADYTGAGVNGTYNFTGSIAEVRIHDGVLSAADIMNNFKLGGPGKAHDPVPPDGAMCVTMPLLQWSAGYTAKWHNVYFGTNPTPGAAESVGERQTDMIYQLTVGLLPGTTYYWRVDEVEADGVTIHEGDVWSFRVAAYPDYADVLGARFIPNNFTAWGELNLSSGQSIHFDTSWITFSIDGGIAQNGIIAQTRRATETAVFCFTNIIIANGVKVTLTGNRPIAILSHADMTIGATFDAGGGNGTRTSGGLGRLGGGNGGTGQMAETAPTAGEGPGAGGIPRYKPVT